MDINKNSNKELVNQIYVDFWTKNPAILLDSDYISQLWIGKNMSKNEKLNALSRLVIILTFISYIFLKNIKILVAGIVTLIIIIFLYYSYSQNNKNEGFANIKHRSNDKLNKIYLNPNYFTQSTVKNPLSNINLPEIKDNPERNPAAPSYNKKIEQKINSNTKEFIAKNFDDENIGKKLFNDLGDNLQFENSMRQFYSTSSTTIPNDQESFLKYCFGDMMSCRDGDSEACFNNAFRHIRHN